MLWGYHCKARHTWGNRCVILRVKNVPMVKVKLGPCFSTHCCNLVGRHVTLQAKAALALCRPHSCHCSATDISSESQAIVEAS